MLMGNSCGPSCGYANRSGHIMAELCDQSYYTWQLTMTDNKHIIANYSLSDINGNVWYCVL